MDTICPLLSISGGGNNSSMVASRVGDRTVTDPSHSILEPAMRRCIPAVEAQLTERLANRTQKSAMRWCGGTDAQCLVRTNDQAINKF